MVAVYRFLSSAIYFSPNQVLGESQIEEASEKKWCTSILARVQYDFVVYPGHGGLFIGLHFQFAIK